MLVSEAENFWKENVLKRVAPPVDAYSAEVLAKLTPVSNGESIELDVRLLDSIENIEMLKNEIKRLELEKKVSENKLKEKLGENEIGIIGDRKVIWKTVSRTSVDSKKLKEEKPEIYDQYLKTTSYRKFDIR